MFLRALGVERAVFESIGWDNPEQTTATFILRVRLRQQDRRRCPYCSRRCPGYDGGNGVRRWRLPDMGLSPAYVEAETARVQCPEHGVVVRAVPWARSGSDFTYAFEETVTWLAVRTDKTTVSTLLRIAWRSVGAILERVSAAAHLKLDVFAKVTRIGIDEVAYRKGHRYLTVVIDHDSGRLLWASPGRDEANLHTFFDLLGPERSAKIRLVSADAASWIGNVVAARCPNATLCLDPFHVVQWATKAVDDVRREVWNRTRRNGDKKTANAIKGSRWALLKNPEDLDGNQRIRLARIQDHNQPIYRAYLLKEQLRDVFKHVGVQARNILDDWLAWASRSKLESFVKLARSIRRNRPAIDAVLEHRLSNARVEAANTKLKLLTRLAFGFHSHAPLVALAMLKLGGLCPALPGRT